MNLADVMAKVKKRPTRKRCGRGPGSGLGKTSGRGHKGAASRSGWRRRYGYDGGQTSLIRRLPKRGFSNALFKVRFDLVNLGAIENNFSAGDTVNLEALVSRGLVTSSHGRLKVLGAGELKKKLTVVAYSASDSAIEKIKAAGAKLELQGPPRKVVKPAPAKPAPAKPGAAKLEPAKLEPAKPVIKKPKKNEKGKDSAEESSE